MANIEQETYLALRHGGASQAKVCAELGVSFGRSKALERRLRSRRPGEGADSMRPRFARDARHIAAVMAAGGYPTLRL